MTSHLIWYHVPVERVGFAEGGLNPVPETQVLTNLPTDGTLTTRLCMRPFVSSYNDEISIVLGAVLAGLQVIVDLDTPHPPGTREEHFIMAHWLAKWLGLTCQARLWEIISGYMMRSLKLQKIYARMDDEHPPYGPPYDARPDHERPWWRTRFYVMKNILVSDSAWWMPM